MPSARDFVTLFVDDKFDRNSGAQNARGRDLFKDRHFKNF